jgi:hypothetical protein
VSYQALATFMKVELALFLAALLLIIFLKIVSGRIRLDGMLRDKKTGKPSYARMQLVLVTLMAAAGFLWGAIGGEGGYENLLELDSTLVDTLIAALAGSHTLYLSGKAGSAFQLFERFRQRKH